MSFFVSIALMLGLVAFFVIVALMSGADPQQAYRTSRPDGNRTDPPSDGGDTSGTARAATSPDRDRMDTGS